MTSRLSFHLQTLIVQTEEELSSVVQPSEADSSKTLELEDSASNTPEPASKSKSPLNPPVVRFDDQVTTISPVNSTTNIAGQQDNLDTTAEPKPLLGRVSSQPLSAPADEEDPNDFDFDWEGRRESIKARSLRNRVRKRFSSNNSESEQANKSTMSSKGNNEQDGADSLPGLKSIVSTLKKVGSTHSNNSSKSESSETTQTQPFDDLPGDRAGLEARLNIHLGRLDRLRNQVRLFNDVIQDYYDYFESQRNIHNLAPSVEAPLIEELEQVLKMRAGFEKSVKFHHNTIDRIARARAQLDKSQGLKCTVWDMYMGFKREAEWAQLFAF
ncbi:hypothetical protein A1O3_03677 [Capronia epimyces CBS 606.96]|uniref:Uncharacterized protein n=1 Tax=Capronia epimyces CBS 606.96 TaxID=1182542 RepID=W9YWR1_9EURO|nr:uncharacterized protein A1O3_03677 [Capronia epimyces CBS 606.96]EXJ86724.1 hypothetical protein A1O3_03677 [Capronia epimyces CBS 606.96]